MKKSLKRGAQKKKACIAKMRKLVKRFEKLWMKRNFRSEIRVTLGRYKEGMK